MKEKNRKPMGAWAEKTTASTADDSIRVWVIEDHVDFRATLMRVLSLEKDFAAQSFGRCEEALTLIKTGATAHVILLDIGLPGMSGLEAITIFKAASPTTQIIMLTA